jgi:hypothetical protein
MAVGKSTFDSAGGAVDDLFAAKAYRFKAEGNRIEQQGYLQAAEFADKNVKYTDMSTGIKEVQAMREISKTMGGQEADIAAAGFSESGSALDIMRESAAQGALTQAVIGEQGEITKEGYRQQAQSFRLQAEAAGVAYDAARTAATGAEISAGIKGVTALATLF